MTHEDFKSEVALMRPQLLMAAQRYVDGDDADDVVQDALLRLWQMVDELHRPLTPLARALVRNLCVDRLRRQPVVLSGDASIAGLSDKTDENGSDSRIDRMMAIIDQLPSLQQTILRLRHIDGMEMKDIAQLIGSTEVALRKALSRARQAVRTQYLKQYER